MDNFGNDGFKIEPSGSEVIEFNLDDEGQEMEIIQSGTIFHPTQPTTSAHKQALTKSKGSGVGRSRVEILPNDDARVVRAGKDFFDLFFRREN